MLCSNHSNGNGSGTAARAMLDIGTASRACIIKLHSNKALSQKLFCRFLPQAGDYDVQVSLDPPAMYKHNSWLLALPSVSWCIYGPAGCWQAASRILAYLQAWATACIFADEAALTEEGLHVQEDLMDLLYRACRHGCMKQAWFSELPPQVQHGASAYACHCS